MDEKMLDAYKELTPVVYGENAIKYLKSGGGPKEVCFPLHWHERMELLYVESGELELYFGKEHERVLTGQTAVVSPGMLHRGVAGLMGVSYHTIMFDVEKFCNETAASRRYLSPICKYKAGFLHVAAQPEIKEVMDRLLRALTGSEGINSLVAIGIIYEVIGLLYQYCPSDSGMLHGTDKGFSRVVEYINANYADRITARSISQKFGYNETYLCRRFKAATGITVMKYIKVLRLEQAQKLLRTTEEEVGDIAWKCGFPEVGYFFFFFKKNFGYTPSEFRKLKEERINMDNEKVYKMDFSKVYQLLVNKAVKKGRTRDEVYEVTRWLTGYSQAGLEELLESTLTYGDFFRNAPRLNENRKLIKGVVCGVRVEEIEEPLMQEIRYLDKLVDELAKGKSMDKILR